MTTFTDFVRDKHFDQYEWQEIDRDDDFDNWKESLNTDSLVWYLVEYNNSLSGTDYARFAYSILQSNN
jgi:hypothetical protein